MISVNAFKADSCACIRVHVWRVSVRDVGRPTPPTTAGGTRRELSWWLRKRGCTTMPALHEKLRDASTATEREPLYTAIDDLVGRPGAAPQAVRCVSPLCAVLELPLDCFEFQRAALVLGSVLTTYHGAFTNSGISTIFSGSGAIGEYVRPGQPNVITILYAPDSALARVFAKPPDELTEEDLMTAVCYYASVNTMYNIPHAQCVSEETFAHDWVEKWMAGCHLLGTHPRSGSHNEALFRLSIGLLQQPNQLMQTSSYVHAGVWYVAQHCCIGRPDVAAIAIECRAIELGVSQLQTARKIERVTSMRFAPIWTFLRDVVQSAQSRGDDFTHQLLDDGCVDLCISALKTAETVEPAAICTMGFINVICLLELLEGEALEAIYDQLRPAAQALRAAIDSNVTFARFDATMEATGDWSSASYGCLLAAKLFGHDEGGGDFNFLQVDLQHVCSMLLEIIKPKVYGMAWEMLASLGAGVAALCRSDENKTKLLRSPLFLDLLLEGLLLDPEGFRRQNGTPEKVLCAVQRDFCECLMQLAVWEPGRQVLAQACQRDIFEPALCTVVQSGWSKEAQQLASNALIALEYSGSIGSIDGDDSDMVRQQSKQHVMLSYNWEHQGTVKRINMSLQKRGYPTWIDVEKMYGSTVEAMASAVEGAAVVIYGVSRAYKESCNCRLEAQYAFQRDKPMVPLMLEEGYRADGWLGMLLGVRLYYAFLGPVLESEAAFEAKIQELTRELDATDVACSLPTAPTAAAVSSSLSEGIPPAPTESQAQPPPHHERRNTRDGNSAALSETMMLNDADGSLVSPTVKAARDGASMVLAGGGGSGREEVEQHLQLLWQENQSQLKVAVSQFRDEMHTIIAQHPMSSDEEAVTVAQLKALQVRALSMHSAKLLTDDEVHALEDTIADVIELQRALLPQVLNLKMISTRLTPNPFEAALRAHRLVGLSEGIEANETFARQLRRRKLFLSSN